MAAAPGPPRRGRRRRLRAAARPTAARLVAVAPAGRRAAPARRVRCGKRLSGGTRPPPPRAGVGAPGRRRAGRRAAGRRRGAMRLLAGRRRTLRVQPARRRRPAVAATLARPAGGAWTRPAAAAAAAAAAVAAAAMTASSASSALRPRRRRQRWLAGGGGPRRLLQKAAASLSWRAGTLAKSAPSLLAPTWPPLLLMARPRPRAAARRMPLAVRPVHSTAQTSRRRDRPPPTATRSKRSGGPRSWRPRWSRTGGATRRAAACRPPPRWTGRARRPALTCTTRTCTTRGRWATR